MVMALDTHGEVSDDALLLAYAAGDRAAARELTLRCAPVALRVAQRMLRDPAEAEDVAQEAMLRLWRIAPEWRPGEAKISTWLYRVTSNLCTDRLRRAGRGMPLEAIDEPADDRPAAVAGMIEADRAEALRQALADLPDRQRQAVVLRHLEGLANPEIAAIMDVGVEAVESLTARGKRALVRALAGRREELGYEDD
ncbi:RNA polymerase sigma factor [Frigidibacter oleivorans]|uniref:RNA polymerase sigma factor n=1 Tax=Frigidibacter oleivorans TaxID=2487129 RepID=UPI000F8D2737|nr:RNA polymerase sigma factor [Frigidibacter oleivorans]